MQPVEISENVPDQLELVPCSHKVVLRVLRGEIRVSVKEVRKESYTAFVGKNCGSLGQQVELLVSEEVARSADVALAVFFEIELEEIDL